MQSKPLMRLPLSPPLSSPRLPSPHVPQRPAAETEKMTYPMPLEPLQEARPCQMPVWRGERRTTWDAEGG